MLMKQCLAPCVDKADRVAYQDIVKQVLMVLEGHNADLEKLLIERIHSHAEKLEFEQAAVLRRPQQAARLSTHNVCVLQGARVVLKLPVV